MIKHIFSEYKEFFSLKKILRVTPEALWVFVNHIGMAIAGLAGVKLLTNLLSPEEYGRLAIANTIIMLISINFFIPIGQGLMRFWAISKERDDLSAFYYVSRKISNQLFYGTFILAVVLFLVARDISSLNGSLLVGLALFTGIISGLISLKTSILTANRRRKEVALLNIGIFLLRPLMAALLIILLYKDTNIALMGYFIAAFLVFLIAKHFYRKLANEQYNGLPKTDKGVTSQRKLRNEILLYSWPFLVWGIFGWVYSFCDRWALKLFYDNKTVGLFSVVSQLAVWPLMFSFSFLNSFFTPIAFERAGNLTQKHSVLSAAKILNLMLFTFGLTVLILLVIFSLFHYQLLRLYSSIHFTKFSYLLPGLTIAWAFYYAGQLLNTLGFAANEPQLYIMPRLIASVLAVFAIFFLVKKIGIEGIVWGLGISGFVYFNWCAWIFYKIFHKKIKLAVVKPEDFLTIQ